MEDSELWKEYNKTMAIILIAIVFIEIYWMWLTSVSIQMF